MSRKRPHRKSRNGCDQCKKRHVKCDEQGPPCLNCSSRDLECYFSRIASTRRLQTGLDSNLNSPSPISSGSQSSVRPESALMRISTNESQDFSSSVGTSNVPFLPTARLRELELMHHWCTKTCRSFTARHTNLFQNYVVIEAIKHKYLMESIFALTCFHIGSEIDDPESATSYVTQGLQYQNNAVRAFHDALQSITSSNCNALFASSVITIACTVVSPLLPTGDYDKEKSPIENFAYLFDFADGITSIVETSREWLECGPFKGMFGFKGPPLRKQGMVFPIQCLRNLNDTVTGTSNSPLHKIYEHAIAQLEICFASEKNTTISWLGMAGKAFANELQKKGAVALMIFMFWGVLLDQMDDIWWAKYLGKRLVKELSRNLLGRGKEWDEATAWATTQVDCDSIASGDKF